MRSRSVATSASWARGPGRRGDRGRRCHRTAPAVIGPRPARSGRSRSRSRTPRRRSRSAIAEQEPDVVALLGQAGGRVGVVAAGDVRRLEPLRAGPDRARRVVGDRVGREGGRGLGAGDGVGLGLGRASRSPRHHAAEQRTAHQDLIGHGLDSPRRAFTARIGALASSLPVSSAVRPLLDRPGDRRVLELAGDAAARGRRGAPPSCRDTRRRGARQHEEARVADDAAGLRVDATKKASFGIGRPVDVACPELREVADGHRLVAAGDVRRTSRARRRGRPRRGRAARRAS